MGVAGTLNINKEESKEKGQRKSEYVIGSS